MEWRRIKAGAIDSYSSGDPVRNSHRKTKSSVCPQKRSYLSAVLAVEITKKMAQVFQGKRSQRNTT